MVIRSTRSIVRALGIDTDRYPTVGDYLAGLPSGLDSHPQCVTKASICRAALGERPLAELDGLPAVLADLVTHPRPVNTWIPEVHSLAVILAMYDRSFADIARFATHSYESQRKLWGSKIYAVLMRWTSPHRLLSTASQRWQLFHRGSTLDIDGASDGRATLRLVHPVGLYAHVSRVGLTEGLRAALDMSTRYRCSITEIDASTTCARWAATWSRR